MLSLGANQICLLALVAAGAEHLAAQAVAILLVTPFSFVANKLWAFAEGGRLAERSNASRRVVNLRPPAVSPGRGLTSS